MKDSQRAQSPYSVMDLSCGEVFFSKSQEITCQCQVTHPQCDIRIVSRSTARGTTKQYCALDPVTECEQM